MNGVLIGACPRLVAYIKQSAMVNTNGHATMTVMVSARFTSTPSKDSGRDYETFFVFFEE
jgi:hypothetical protein